MALTLRPPAYALLEVMISLLPVPKAGMLAADGRCKTLDAAANGYVRSEACAALLLQPLDDAAADGIGRPAVLLRACAMNQDGRSSALTAPNGAAQQVRGFMDSMSLFCRHECSSVVTVLTYAPA